MPSVLGILVCSTLPHSHMGVWRATFLSYQLSIKLLLKALYLWSGIQSSVDQEILRVRFKNVELMLPVNPDYTGLKLNEAEKTVRSTASCSRKKGFLKKILHKTFRFTKKDRSAPSSKYEEDRYFLEWAGLPRYRSPEGHSYGPWGSSLGEYAKVPKIAKTESMYMETFLRNTGFISIHNLLKHVGSHI